MDLNRIFWGDMSWALAGEIALRTAVMYLYTLAVVRVMGKRGLGQLSPFELVIIVALGSAVGDPMFYTDVPLIHGLLVITAVVALQRALVHLTERNQTLERMIESVPVLLVSDGRIVDAALDQEDLSEAELLMALRQNGIEYLGEVRRAYLEPSGQLSVFRAEPPYRPGRSTLP